MGIDTKTFEEDTAAVEGNTIQLNPIDQHYERKIESYPSNVIYTT